ncbi:type II secretion system minor pseudopilin GspJ [Aquicella lusitana]|uniref:Type II secretion system protein J n=1 Tax=Aquicella lusitana TaxID=254246 RepID=A0A370G2X5_9COXI|nr:type II secretion system minor pseudopilin GspJ [Aquicella lusitana]RDI38062.1 general secretion pathway protein J [Aquicella lusitana]VVC72638.1 Type II secretion system protein J [Aquicella lusitana]
MKMRRYHACKQRGFTLLEILIALFIFTILSLILANALHNVITIQSGTERNAERLRELQMVLLVMSRDVEQAVNRPIVNASGKEEAAFIGTPHSFTFTHTGFANPTGELLRSNLQRTRYDWNRGSLRRGVWPSLDAAPDAKPHARTLLNNVEAARFEYLDQNGRPHAGWPVQGQTSQPLPRAVRISLTISQWGKLSQLYVISAEPSKTISLPPKP